MALEKCFFFVHSYFGLEGSISCKLQLSSVGDLYVFGPEKKNIHPMFFQRIQMILSLLVLELIEENLSRNRYQAYKTDPI